QKGVCESLANVEDHSVTALLPHVSALLSVVNQARSPALLHAAQELAGFDHDEWLELLSHGWQPEQHEQELLPEYAFFVQALLQPQAEYLAGRTSSPTESSPSLCPFCNSKPQ